MSERPDPTKPIFPIGVAAELTGLSPKILRTFDHQGLLSAYRRGTGAHRLYSLQDVEALRYARYLRHVRQINAQGIRYVLEILSRLSLEQRRAIISEAQEALPEADSAAPK